MLPDYPLFLEIADIAATSAAAALAAAVAAVAVVALGEKACSAEAFRTGVDDAILAAAAGDTAYLHGKTVPAAVPVAAVALSCTSHTPHTALQETPPPSAVAAAVEERIPSSVAKNAAAVAAAVQTADQVRCRGSCGSSDTSAAEDGAVDRIDYFSPSALYEAAPSG